MEASVVDLFCGVGGLAYGLRTAGFKVNAGIDIDKTCKYAFEENCDSKFICKSISDLTDKELKDLYPLGDTKILVGCAPCQPFSSYTSSVDKGKDKRWQLLYDFVRLIENVKPEIVSMENVPQLLHFKKAPVFQDFVSSLKALGYNVWWNVVFAPDYGIPQKRKRLILLASKLGPIELIPPTHTPDQYVTVKDAIGNLEPIEHGTTSNSDYLHKTTKLSPLNLKRLSQSKPGGSWRDWDEALKLKCHKEESGKTYGSVYGRMSWYEPAPTMTTLCTGIGNGRFGHPDQLRAISIREAAILQSFPPQYKFANSIENTSTSQLTKHIGNAVPPRLGEVIGLSIREHFQKNYGKN